MKHYTPYSIAVAVCLSAMAGYVDAVGFMELGGYFISFMSGNSTRLVVSAVHGDWAHVLLIALILLCFVGGSFAGTIAGNMAGAGHRPLFVLLLVTLCLAAAILCYELHHSLSAVLCTAFAMGAENAVFERDGDIGIGLTYMTGTLVKLGQRLAQRFFGGGAWDFLPYLLLWLGLVTGGAMGALLYLSFGLSSLWLALLWSACLMLLLKLRPAQ